MVFMCLLSLHKKYVQNEKANHKNNHSNCVHNSRYLIFMIFFSKNVFVKNYGYAICRISTS